MENKNVRFIAEEVWVGGCDLGLCQQWPLSDNPNQTDLLTRAWAVRAAPGRPTESLHCKAYVSVRLGSAQAPSVQGGEGSFPTMSRDLPNLPLLKMRESTGKGEIGIPWLMDVRSSPVKGSHRRLCLPHQVEINSSPPFCHLGTRNSWRSHTTHAKARFMAR